MENNPAPQIYQIHVNGQLDERWNRWFDGLTITTNVCGETIITGSMLDQAALHGILNRIRDLGLDLISVRRLNAKDEPGRRD
jgi:hypothetical protein